MSCVPIDWIDWIAIALGVFVVVFVIGIFIATSDRDLP
jgi:hypothetical protein